MEKLKIGITGHRDIRTEDMKELSSVLDERIKMLQEANPDKQLQMLNALASGADRLAADYAIRSGFELVAILPFTSEEYEKDFTDEDLTEYRNQLKYASEIIISGNETDPDENTRDDGYRAAGRYIADNCDYLIAFWDGTPGTDEGCGTADIVKYFIDKHSDKLIHIKTRRQDKRRLTEIKDEADDRSLLNQKAYMNCLQLLSVLGIALVLVFICYDNFGLDRMILIYAALIIIGAVIVYIAGKRKYHENYVNYRLLAEILRVQKVMDLAGIRKNAADFLPQTLREETDWIYRIVETGVHDEPIADMDTLKFLWLEEQLNYHIGARQKTEKKLKRNNIISTAVMIITLGVIAWACILEFIPALDINAEAGILTLKNGVLILVGILSAISVFLSSYYGKQNLERKCHDHINMAKLYDTALKENEGKPMTKETIEGIAREEILENSNWYSYMKESRLSLDL